jgi:hypothetical protein
VTRRDEPLPTVAWEHFRRLAGLCPLDAWRAVVFPGDGLRVAPMSHDAVWAAWAPVVEVAEDPAALAAPPIRWCERRCSVVCEDEALGGALRWRILPGRATILEFGRPEDFTALVTISHRDAEVAVRRRRTVGVAEHAATVTAAAALGMLDAWWVRAVTRD